MLDRAQQLALRSKVTARLIPFLFLLYMVAYLDRVNVSFAALQMREALHFSKEIYGFGAGVFFIGYFILEIPSNLLLEKVGARIWIARIMFTWGILAAAMMFMTKPWHFYALRFALGLAEAGFFPGVILYLTYWYPAKERARAVGLFMTATAISGVVGSPISGFLLKMNGLMHIQGWQWLFLLEGLPACLLGFVVLAYLPNGPQDATWISDEERAHIAAQLAPEHEKSEHKHENFGAALQSPRVWLLCAIYFGQALGSYGLSMWLPQVVKGLSGTNDQMVGLITAVPYLMMAVGMVVNGIHSDRTGERVRHVAFPALWGTVWLFASRMVPSGTAALACVVIAALGTSAMLGPFWVLPSAMLSGTAAAAGIALINSVGNLGGFVGPYLGGLVEDWTKSSSNSLYVVAGGYLLVGVLALLVKVPRTKPGAGQNPEAEVV